MKKLLLRRVIFLKKTRRISTKCSRSSIDIASYIEKLPLFRMRARAAPARPHRRRTSSRVHHAHSGILRKSRRDLFLIGVIKGTRAFLLFHLISLARCVARGLGKKGTGFPFPPGRNRPLTTSVWEIYCVAFALHRDEKNCTPAHSGKKLTRFPRTGVGFSRPPLTQFLSIL